MSDTSHHDDRQRLLLHVPSHPNRRITLPFLPHVPPPDGRKLPNGTIIATDDATPSLLYKFTPWTSSGLASNEIDIYSRLRDLADPSGIVALTGVSGTQDHLVRVLERSHAGSLQKYLFDQARGDRRLVDPALARRLLAQVARTLADMHALGLVHRDLKAENVFVFDAETTENVKAKVADFDRTIALPMGSFLQEPVGSLFHMAPELFAWKQYDRKVDVYAFGILMFEVLHGGAQPYANVANCMPDSISRADFVSKVVDEGFRPDWLHGDEALQHLASLCWAAAPDNRPDFEQIVEALQPGSGRREPSARATRGNRRQQENLGAVGLASDIGKARMQMEDAVCVLETSDTLIACVFDGLRGARTSEFLARHFAMVLMDEIRKADGDVEGAMKRSFTIADTILRRIEPPIECGSTAVVAVLREGDLFLSWLGDSPAYLFRKAKGDAGFSSQALIDRHHPDRAAEAARITANGGIVGREQRWLDSGETMPWGPARVFMPQGSESGGIALSRAFGLFSFKPAIGADPETVRLKRGKDDLFLVLGSDGVFDLLSPEAVYEIIDSTISPQHAADAVVEVVLDIGAPDNSSIVIIALRKLPLASR